MGEEGGRAGNKEKKLVENSKRNDLRDRRNRVAEYYNINDIKTFHHVNVIEKYDGEKHVVIKCATLVENQTGLKHHFILIWVIAIYLNEAKPYTNKKIINVEFFSVKIEL